MEHLSNRPRAPRFTAQPEFLHRAIALTHKNAPALRQPFLRPRLLGTVVDRHAILNNFLRRRQAKSASTNEEPQPDLLLVGQMQVFREPFGEFGLVDLQAGE